jgi:hypothetical protein
MLAKRLSLYHYLIIMVGIALALMGEPFAGGMLLLGVEVGIAFGREGHAARKEVEEPAGD